MLFWTVVTLISLAVAATLARALLIGGSQTGPAPASYDMEIYRDQLAEVDRDVARGALPQDEANRVRTEISRRLLAADAALKAQTGDQTRSGPRRWIALLSAVALVGGALALYDHFGAPGYPDMPRAGRIAEAQQLLRDLPTQAALEADPRPLGFDKVEPSEDFAKLMDQLRAAVAERPDDLQGQQLLSRNEAALGNFAAAARAQSQWLRLAGPVAGAQDYADYADLMILAAGGEISAEAGAALQQALRLDPDNGTATYYSGLLMARTGRPDLAFRLWDRLLRSSPEDAPWMPLVRAQIGRVADLAGEENYVPPAPAPATAPLAGPTADDVTAAQDMTPEDRQQMIRGMVTQLETRLGTEGGTVQEWARLISSLGVLGETDHAREIYGEAQKVFAADTAALSLLKTAAQSAGLTE